MKNHGKILVLLLTLVSALTLHAAEITVDAAASLTDVLKELGANYEKTIGDKVLFNFAASNTLVAQIKAGAPVDAFFSADEAKMDDLAKADLIAADTRKDLLVNTLAIIVPADSKAHLASAAGLADEQFRKIALGQMQSVPAGIYARTYLESIGLWDKISPRVIPSESVRAVLAAVETGNVDAGIVYKTDALHSKKVRIVWEVAAANGPAIAYPVALLKSAKQPEAAKKFLAYLSDPASLKVFEKYGFITKG